MIMTMDVYLTTLLGLELKGCNYQDDLPNKDLCHEEMFIFYFFLNGP